MPWGGKGGGKRREKRRERKAQANVTPARYKSFKFEEHGPGPPASLQSQVVKRRMAGAMPGAAGPVCKAPLTVSLCPAEGGGVREWWARWCVARRPTARFVEKRSV